jgi:hypothetical protein
MARGPGPCRRSKMLEPMLLVLAAVPLDWPYSAVCHVGRELEVGQRSTPF